ncbi:MAG: isoprenylcysteine carboxylmethyltransferase family protein [Ruminiclostridium sp.]|nr:isoprenylcysteine carboxylmethyltransferase family protein [Ruminiclostridium sp.]
MTKTLFFQALAKFFFGLLLVGLLVFLPAGTLHYPQGWLFMAILFVPMFFAGLVMMARNPALLKSRLDAKEKQREQERIVKLSGLMFLFGFVLAGLTFRFGWFVLPWKVSLGAAAVFLLAYLLYAEVLRENTWLSRTIEVQENQTVVDTGLYGLVRHPMYSATLLLFLSMPLVLGSLPSFLVFWAYPALIVRRLKQEEEVLERELTGYSEYKQAVKYRLIPFIW